MSFFQVSNIKVNFENYWDDDDDDDLSDEDVENPLPYVPEENEEEEERVKSEDKSMQSLEERARAKLPEDFSEEGAGFD